MEFSLKYCVRNSVTNIIKWLVVFVISLSLFANGFLGNTTIYLNNLLQSENQSFIYAVAENEISDVKNSIPEPLSDNLIKEIENSKYYDNQMATVNSSLTLDYESDLDYFINPLLKNEFEMTNELLLSMRNDVIGTNNLSTDETIKSSVDLNDYDAKQVVVVSEQYLKSNNLKIGDTIDFVSIPESEKGFSTANDGIIKPNNYEEFSKYNFEIVGTYQVYEAEINKSFNKIKAENDSEYTALSLSDPYNDMYIPFETAINLNKELISKHYNSDFESLPENEKNSAYDDFKSIVPTYAFKSDSAEGTKGLNSDMDNILKETQYSALVVNKASLRDTSNVDVLSKIIQYLNSFFFIILIIVSIITSIYRIGEFKTYNALGIKKLQIATRFLFENLIISIPAISVSLLASYYLVSSCLEKYKMKGFLTENGYSIINVDNLFVIVLYSTAIILIMFITNIVIYYLSRKR